MKITRKYGGTEVEIDTDLMTGRQKMFFVLAIATGAVLTKMNKMHDKMTGKDSRSSKSSTKK